MNNETLFPTIFALIAGLFLAWSAGNLAAVSSPFGVLALFGAGLVGSAAVLPIPHYPA